MDTPQILGDIQNSMDTIDGLVEKIQEQLSLLNYNENNIPKKCNFEVRVDLQSDKTHEFLSYSWAKCNLGLNHSNSHKFKIMVSSF